MRLTHMKPVMKQKAANGAVVCAGSTSAIRYDRKESKDAVCFTASTADDDDCVPFIVDGVEYNESYLFCYLSLCS